MKIRTSVQVEDKDFYKTLFEQSLRHRIELPYDKAIEYVKAIGYYNEFDHIKIRQMLEEIDGEIPRAEYGKDNPNNGNRVYEIEIGRESSPVIYIKMYRFSHNQLPKDFKDIDLKAIEAQARLTGKADEFSHEIRDVGFGGTELVIRMWWD